MPLNSCVIAMNSSVRRAARSKLEQRECGKCSGFGWRAAFAHFVWYTDENTPSNRLDFAPAATAIDSLASAYTLPHWTPLAELFHFRAPPLDADRELPALRLEVSLTANLQRMRVLKFSYCSTLYSHLLKEFVLTSLILVKSTLVLNSPFASRFIFEVQLQTYA